jgi:hypothetical protein
MGGSKTVVAKKFNVTLYRSNTDYSKTFFYLKLKWNFADFLRPGSSYKTLDVRDIKYSLLLVETYNLHVKHSLR